MQILKAVTLFCFIFYRTNYQFPIWQPSPRTLCQEQLLTTTH